MGISTIRSRIQVFLTFLIWNTIKESSRGESIQAEEGVIGFYRERVRPFNATVGVDKGPWR